MNATALLNGSDLASRRVDEPTSAAVFYSVATFMTVGCLLGTTLNGVAVIVFAKTKHLRTPTNVFVIALCVCDLLMCLIGMPIPAVYAWRRQTIDNDAICTFDAFAVYLVALTSMYVLAAMSVDRYMVIVRPMSTRLVTHRVACLAVGLCFVLALAFACMPLLGWNGYVREGIGVACSIIWDVHDAGATSFVISLFVFCLLLPLLVMTFCYVSLYRAIRTVARTSPWGAESQIAQNNLRLERKMLKTVVIMIGAFLVSWTPYAIVSFLGSFSGRHVLTPVLETFPAMIAKCSALWDPLIYLATNQQFRRALSVLCPSCVTCLQCLDASDAAASVTAVDLASQAPNIARSGRPAEAVAAQDVQLPQSAGDRKLAHLEHSSANTLETRVTGNDQSMFQSTDCCSLANMKVALDDLPAVETARF